MQKLGPNITGFVRLLRRAGLPIGSSQIIESLRAVDCIGLEDRDDFKSTLSATLITAAGQRPLFDQAFELYFANPDWARKQLAAMLPQTLIPPPEPDDKPGSRRLAEALTSQGKKSSNEKTTLELDARGTISSNEVLARKDFAQMSTEELNQVRSALRATIWELPKRRSRRTKPSPQGQSLDFARTMRQAVRDGGDMLTLVRRKPQTREPDLIVLCDISGSMSHYARMALHYIHGITQHRKALAHATHTFVFATRLTNISRALRMRDADEALARVGNTVNDWDGGTRIADALKTFNKDWSRRTLSAGAVIVLITDGLERDDAESLKREAQKLRRSAARIIWLNPLLRYDQFAPKAMGIKALLPYVDEFRPVHNMQSLKQLAAALTIPLNTRYSNPLKAYAA